MNTVKLVNHAEDGIHTTHHSTLADALDYVYYMTEITWASTEVRGDLEMDGYSSMIDNNGRRFVISPA